ncbi:hypothetical protein Kpol_1028p23 [Vanderwaltozyma polyspora DSM 70294]|uniref:General transcriptional corepressor TUP1 n=1 Tax=Vanderwaltozyma polyspora (strain ATCC 22028 / DSM 70294 / BCRC 21397 / CBS 2163 / NBRC 10782 / NRRL Y-8283 / UCD 57-17) TaxID=436907 RepID=A7TFZ3_VANPO|nr:uncharacterized protein Kpol_1028p23 [Vanderwaltozyma polyspora DSM 70294]EDO18750.1 hypothetical protein Kpol_1028p23 [Vanderwaltozyma polyspora DSM 70294]
MSAAISNSQSKINELLEAVKQEFAQVSQDANSYRLQNQKDYDSKINQQLAEMQQIRNTVYELELTHRKMKDAYEEEINRLKIELDQRDRQLASLTAHHHQQQQHQQQQHQQHQQQGSPAMLNVPFSSHMQQGAPSAVPQPQFQGNVSNQMPPQLPVITSNQQQQLQQQQNLQGNYMVTNPLPVPTVQSQITQQEGSQQMIPPIEAPSNNVATPATQPIPMAGTPATSAVQAPTQAPVAAKATATPSLPAVASQTSPVVQPVSTPPVAGAAPAPAATASSTTTPVAQESAQPTKTQTPVEEEKPQVTKEEERKPAVAGTTEEQESHYLVPYNQRANHTKPIPPFLLDLDSQIVPPHLKKQTNDYYILYNPALPREINVDLLHSLDHTSVVCCVRFSNDGQFLATGCNKTTQVFRVSDGELVARLSDDSTSQGVQGQSDAANGTADGTSGETNSFATSTSASSDLYIRSVCFSPDGKFLATGAEDRLIRIWDIAQKKIVMVLQGHEQDIYSLDYFPSGDKLVSGSGDRTVRIWDLRNGQCSLTLSIEDGVTTVAVSPGDGKYIAAGSLDRAVRVWDSETGFLVERLDSENELGTGHKDSVYSVVFTRDGNNVVSGSLDRSVKLWNLRGDNNQDVKPNVPGTCEVTYTGHKDFVLSVATTQNDEYILSGSKDRGVLFWDTKSGNPLLMLQGHRNSVISVAVANGFPLGPNVGVFATGSGDCKARIWKYTRAPATENINDPKIKEVKE